MNSSDVGKKAFTMAIFEAAAGQSQDDDSCCLVCGKAAERMLRFTDFTQSEPLEMRWCEKCWSEHVQSGKLDNPMSHLGDAGPITPAYLITELNLTELPLPDALERLYGACDMIKGGCIRCSGASELPLVGPIKIRSQPLSSALDSLLGPIGMKWDISRGVVMIAHSDEDVEALKQQELAPDAPPQM